MSKSGNKINIYNIVFAILWTVLAAAGLVFVFKPKSAEIKPTYKVDKKYNKQNKIVEYIVGAISLFVVIYYFLIEYRANSIITGIFSSIIIFIIPLLILAVFIYIIYSFFVHKTPWVPLAWRNQADGSESGWLTKPIQYMAMAFIIAAAIMLAYAIVMIYMNVR